MLWQNECALIISHLMDVHSTTKNSSQSKQALLGPKLIYDSVVNWCVA